MFTHPDTEAGTAAGTEAGTDAGTNVGAGAGGGAHDVRVHAFAALSGSDKGRSLFLPDGCFLRSRMWTGNRALHAWVFAGKSQLFGFVRR